MKNIVVIYHNDLDGFGAAWAAWKKFGNKAKYLASDYTMPVHRGLKNKEIYFLDFCYALSEMKKLKKEAKSITIIDHHISKKSVLKIADNYSYNVNNSGAVLAWKYFYPQKPIPKLLFYIEDDDLYQFKMPFTKKLIAFLNFCDLKFFLWNKIADDFENFKKRKAYIKKGEILLKYEEIITRHLISHVIKIKFNGYNALVVNSPVFHSKIGHILVEKNPPIGVVWYQHNGQNVFSLRSNGKVDVSKIAKKYGGGGHKAAAGFELDIKKGMPWKYLR